MRHASHTATRRGVSVLESVTSLLMLGATLAIVAQAVVAIDQQARLRGQSELASFYLQNACEQLPPVAGQPTDVLRQARAIGLTEEAKQALPNAQLMVDVSELESLPQSLRVTFTLRWHPTVSQQPRKLSLSRVVPRAEDQP